MKQLKRGFHRPCLVGPDPRGKRPQESDTDAQHVRVCSCKHENGIQSKVTGRRIELVKDKLTLLFAVTPPKLAIMFSTNAKSRKGLDFFGLLSYYQRKSPLDDVGLERTSLTASARAVPFDELFHAYSLSISHIEEGLSSKIPRKNPFSSSLSHHPSKAAFSSDLQI
ncbi:hypothetical protein VNO77_00240 [Canavalia gladiata]|uniref:Uncharacterized protein n=1 Tax=Canavalia gladiata TaxID=3824 RepID=A0AAN9MVH5_CANGL